VPGRNPASDTVYVSFGSLSRTPLNVPIVFCMFLCRVAAAPAGMLSSQKLTLCGPPETLTKRTTSPTCAETLTGWKRYPEASPNIRTTIVAFARVVVAGLAAPLRDEPAANVPAEIKAILAVNLEMVIAESIIGVWR